MEMHEFSDAVWAELDRLGLTPDTCPASSFALSGEDDPAAQAAFLRHLRALAPGATWEDAFPGISSFADDDDEDLYVDDGYPVGPFDYPEAPRGSAVFGVVDSTETIAAAEASMRRVIAAGVPVYGAAMVLDRGHPHFYVVLERGTPDEVAWTLLRELSDQPGINNVFMHRLESSNPPPTASDAAPEGR